MATVKILKSDELLKLDIVTVTKKHGVTGYLRYKLLQNPHYLTSDYREIREELFKDLTIKLLRECLMLKCSQFN